MAGESFELGARVGVDAAQEVLSIAHALLGENGADGSALTIDASAVEAIEGPAVVAIANIAETFAGRDRRVAVMAPTPAFIDAFTDLGLYGQLMKMEFQK